MIRTECNLRGRHCVLCRKQRGFTFVEILFVMMVFSILAWMAQPIINLGARKISHLTNDETSSIIHITQAIQWISNDVMQWRGYLPWRWQGSLDANSCLVRWEFATSNLPVIDSGGIASVIVVYKVVSDNLYRSTMTDQIEQDNRLILSGVKCIHPDFWVNKKWVPKLKPNDKVEGLRITFLWSGVTVNKIWAVNATY